MKMQFAEFWHFVHCLKLAATSLTLHPCLNHATSSGAAGALAASAPPPEISYESVPFQGVTARFCDAWDNITGLPVRARANSNPCSE